MMDKTLGVRGVDFLKVKCDDSQCLANHRTTYPGQYATLCSKCAKEYLSQVEMKYCSKLYGCEPRGKGHASICPSYIAPHDRRAAVEATRSKKI